MSLVELAQQLTNGVITAGVYALVALGLTMIYGILGVVNFAHGEFYMAGAYIGYLITRILGIPFLPGLMLAIAATALMGVLVERLAFRPLLTAPPGTLIISSLGLSIALQNLSLILFGPQPVRLPSPYSSIVFEVFGVTLTLQRLLVLVVAILLIVVLHLVITRTKVGLGMRAMAQDMAAARLMGINVSRVTMVTFALGAALAGAAGTLIGSTFLLSPTMGVGMVFKAFAVVILGGIGSVTGAIWGSLILGLTESLTVAFISSDVKDIAAFLVLVIMLVVKPSGLLGTPEGIDGR